MIKYFSLATMVLLVACGGQPDENKGSNSGSSSSSSSGMGVSKMVGNKDPAILKSGKAFWEQHCQSCHGSDLVGTGASLGPVDLSSTSLAKHNIFNRADLVQFVDKNMPRSAAGACTTTNNCADDVSDFLIAGLKLSGEPIVALNCEKENATQPLLKRLSQAEYNRTVESLFGPGSAPNEDFIGEAKVAGFDGASDISDAAEITTYLQETERLAGIVMNRLDEFSPELAAAGDMTQVLFSNFLQEIGLKVFRRPLTNLEVQRYENVYNAGRSYGNTTDGTRGVRWGLEALFGSPNFIYHVESSAASTNELIRALDAYERANRISYFMTGTMPDETAFAKAAKGSLATKEQVLAEAQRLANTPAGKERLMDFLLQWLGVDENADSLALERFAGENGDAEQGAKLLFESLKKTIEYALEQDFTLDQFLTSSVFHISPELAEIWGDAASGKSGYVDLISEDRIGILTHPAVLSVHSTTGFASPSFRGSFMLDQLICAPVPPPPDSVIEEFPTVLQGLSDRESLAMHNTVPECAFCHARMDPMGYAFGNFDSEGRYILQKNNKPIITADAANILGNEIAFNGVVDMMQEVSRLDVVRDCMGKHALRYAFNRIEDTAESCSIEQYTTTFVSGNEKLSELLVSLVTTETFGQVINNQAAAN